jgi:hypothetical protein
MGLKDSIKVAELNFRKLFTILKPAELLRGLIEKSCLKNLIEVAETNRS